MTSPPDDADIRIAHIALSWLHVEREERPDGRYVLYFRWPDPEEPDPAASENLKESPEPHV